MKRGLNVAFLTSEYVTEPNYDGGLANYLYRVAQGLRECGHRPEIFTRSAADGQIVHHGITVHRIKLKRHFSIVFLKRITRSRFSESLDVFTLSHCLKRKFLERHDEVGFDIVQASSYLAPGLLFTLNCPVPVVTRVSSYEPLWRKYYQKKLSLDQQILEWLEVLAMRRSSAVYAPSSLLSTAIMREKKVRVDVISPPFRVETSERDDSVYRDRLRDKKYLLFFGNLGYLKGCGVIADSLPEIFSQWPDVQFAFVGRNLYGPGKKSMLDHLLARAGHYRNNIHYLGVLPHTSLYSVLENAHAVVLPSLVDNIPNTMLESMALGKVVIGTKGASFEEFITDGVSGFLVDCANPSQLSRVVGRAWNLDEKASARIGSAARDRILKLDPEVMCRYLEEYYRRTIERRNIQRSAFKVKEDRI